MPDAINLLPEITGLLSIGIRSILIWSRATIVKRGSNCHGAHSTHMGIPALYMHGDPCKTLGLYLSVNTIGFGGKPILIRSLSESLMYIIAGDPNLEISKIQSCSKSHLAILTSSSPYLVDRPPVLYHSLLHIQC